MADPSQLAAETRAWAALRAYAATEDENEKSQAYNEFRTQKNYVSPEVKDHLDEAIAEIDAVEAEEALAVYAAVAAKIRKLEQGFKIGEDMANDATGDLFFPAAAAYLAQVSDILSKLKKAAEDIQGKTGNLQGAFEKRDLAGIIADVEKVKNVAVGIEEVFDTLRDGLPGD